MTIQIDQKMKNLSVQAIEQGTVIDHILPGMALRLMEALKLTQKQQLITLGIYLPSSRMGKKDLIKVANWRLSKEETQKIAIFSPGATVSIIEQYQVIEKGPVEMPKQVEGLFFCPNPRCITNHEEAKRTFFIEVTRKKITLRCKHCEKQFEKGEIRRC